MICKHLAAFVLCLTAAAPAVADSGSADVDVRTHVPATCTFSVGTPTVVTLDPLFIRVFIERNCNAANALTLTYLPAKLTLPNSLVVLFEDRLPDQKSPGVVTFTNLPNTGGMSRTRMLRIYYSGPASERTQIKNTAAFNVSAMP